MNDYPLVSIITPTYGHEKFIGQCIESVLSQTYSNWEHIIIDDGSTDRTGEIITNYKDARIKYVRQDNIGIWRMGETYNKALQICKGELIAILDDDDFWPSWKLEKQVPAFDRPEVVLSWGRAGITNHEGKTLYYSADNIKWFFNKSRNDLLKRLLFNNFIMACTAMCRKDALLSIKGFKQPNNTPFVDYPTWLELCLIGEFNAIDEILGFWRRHGKQSSATRVKEMIEGQNRCMIEFYNSLPEATRFALGISSIELAKAYMHNITIMNLTLGRINLSKCEWNKAREKFKLAFDKGTISIKAKALIGLTCSYLNLDLNSTAKLIKSLRLGEQY